MYNINNRNNEARNQKKQKNESVFNSHNNGVIDELNDIKLMNNLKRTASDSSNGKNIMSNNDEFGHEKGLQKSIDTLANKLNTLEKIIMESNNINV